MEDKNGAELFFVSKNAILPAETALGLMIPS